MSDLTARKRKKPKRDTSPRVVELKPATEEKPLPGTPKMDNMVTLGEKLAKAEKLKRRHPSPAYDPQFDAAAHLLLSEAVGRFARAPELWPEVSLYGMLGRLCGDNNVLWRSFYLIEMAIDRVFPENTASTGRINGVIWLNDVYAKSVGDITYVMEEVLRDTR
jgi:hypothetical protein